MGGGDAWTLDKHLPGPQRDWGEVGGVGGCGGGEGGGGFGTFLPVLANWRPTRRGTTIENHRGGPLTSDIRASAVTAKKIIEWASPPFLPPMLTAQTHPPTRTHAHTHTHTHGHSVSSGEAAFCSFIPYFYFGAKGIIETLALSDNFVRHFLLAENEWISGEKGLGSQKMVCVCVCVCACASTEMCILERTSKVSDGRSIDDDDK